MQVILLQRVGRIGQMGDVVNVKDGFARNFLLPQKKALRATKENIAKFEAQRAHFEATNLEQKKAAQAIATKLDGQIFIIIRSAGDTGQLYGSVSTRDIAEAANDGGFRIERTQVVLDKAIKVLGLHDAKIQLHPEVFVKIILNVARSTDEATRQARGENISIIKTEKPEIETFDASSMFEEGVPAAVSSTEN
ncbi:MAG: 50S ribosomal protein L9 [Hyphomicrobium sp.]